MQNLILEILFTIVGLGSASGIFYDNKTAYIVSDNASVLYEYHQTDQSLKKHPLMNSSVTENIPKKEKADYESLAHDHDYFYAFGSGSKKKRMRMIKLDRKTKTVVGETDLTPLYMKMMATSGIGKDDFNIEAVVNKKGKWYLFNRGNGPANRNVIFTIEGELSAESPLTYKDFKLPSEHGTTANFTDAVLVGNHIYFLAAAEDIKSTYQDGDVLGSWVGKIDLAKMELLEVERIKGNHKFEGIALYEEDRKNISFLLCEDNDTSVLEAHIYKLTLKK